MKQFGGSKALITGGCGFIGSHLARKLLELGAEVTIVDSMIPEYGGNLFNIRDIARFVRLNLSDVRDPYSLAHLVKGQDFLFNLAGQTSHLDSMKDPFTDLAINSQAQLSILESCRLHNRDIRIVFASTRQIYGRPERLPVDEHHALRPVDVNGINKLSGEMYHLLYNDVYGIRSCALRLTNTYGPAMRVKDARQTFVGIWIRRLIEGSPIEVWGGAQLRDFNFVTDVVDAHLRCALSPEAVGKVFNLGSAPPISLSELAGLMIRLHGGGESLVQEFPAERQQIDIGDYYSDFSLIQRTLGWEPSVELEDGLRRTLRYYADHLGEYL